MGAWPPAPKPRKVTMALSFEQLRDFIQKQMRMSPLAGTLVAHSCHTLLGKSSSGALSVTMAPVGMSLRVSKDYSCSSGA